MYVSCMWNWNGRSVSLLLYYHNTTTLLAPSLLALATPLHRRLSLSSSAAPLPDSLWCLKAELAWDLGLGLGQKILCRDPSRRGRRKAQPAQELSLRSELSTQVSSRAPFFSRAERVGGGRVAKKFLTEYRGGLRAPHSVFAYSGLLRICAAKAKV